MPIVEFSQKYSVNIKSLDDQHRKLFDLINLLNTAMKQSQGKEVLGRVLHELEQYSHSHFSKEEKYMRQYGYAGAAAHIAEHVKFILRIKEFRQGFESSQLALSVQVINFLKQWLTTHILVTDKKYAVCFQEHGVK